jgi:hypothetical protein
MSQGNVISCKQFQNFLVSQEPVYDREILKDVRPYDGLIGYYNTGAFDAYSGTQHTFDRFKSVFPNVTAEWKSVNGTSCSGNPCDPEENKIGWGYERNTYGLENQSWGSQILCFDQIMTKTRAKEHFRQIIDDVLRPATNWVTTYYLQRKAMELAGAKFAVAAGLPEITFTWDAGGYIYLNVDDASGNPVDATGRLTPEILKSRVTRQFFLGAIQAGKEGYDSLQLHTDKDTFAYLGKEVPTLYDSWRFGTFGPAAKEFYKYGFMGYIGDFMAKVLQFPLRFNRVAAGRYQVVLPYKNVAVTEGIGSDFNEDYDNAQYQISYINNPRALRVMPYRPEAVNPNMPFLVRDYGGKWKFATNDLGADCNGKPIDNSRGNKGKFYADFQLAVKPEHPEWLEAIFHKVDKPCITIVPTCNTDPGYPAQSYDSANATCPGVIRFTAVENGSGNYVVDADGITCDGNVVALGGTITNATLAGFVSALQTAWAGAASMTGTWTVVDADTNLIQLAGTEEIPLECTDVQVAFNL